jgi:dTMP kinase
MTESMGKFIVIEGLDGSGKTMQSRLLAEHLRGLGFKVSLSFEPTNGPIGSVIRQALLGRVQLDPRALAALFAADRLDHLYNPVNGIVKHIQEGIIEVCDRYDLTSYAYQTRAADEQWVWQINSQAIRPDLTIFLDVDPEECNARLRRSLVDDEMFHDLTHLREARGKYMAVISALRDKSAIVVIDGNLDAKAVSQQIAAAVENFLASSGRSPS